MEMSPVRDSRRVPKKGAQDLAKGHVLSTTLQFQTKERDAASGTLSYREAEFSENRFPTPVGGENGIEATLLGKIRAPLYGVDA